MTAFLASCGQTELQARRAGESIGATEVADSGLPELPADCREKESAGVRKGDRLDEAVLRYDAALNRQNARTDRCAGWYDRAVTGEAQ